MRTSRVTPSALLQANLRRVFKDYYPKPEYSRTGIFKKCSIPISANQIVLGMAKKMPSKTCTVKEDNYV
jgi:hypothetical protein